MANNFYNDKKGRYEISTTTIRTVDQAVVDYFDKKIAIHVDTQRGRNKVPVIFAAGERWKLIRDKKGLRDENGMLILPLLTVRRTDIDRTKGFGGMAQEVPFVTVTSNIHSKTGNLQNRLEQRRLGGLPVAKKERQVAREYLTIPFPDFMTVFYEVAIWTQFQSQMNEVLEKIFHRYEHMDSFVMPVDYDGKKPKGDGYYFVGFRDGNVSSQSNVEEFTDQERIIRYSYTIKVPAYLMLDPKDEPLSYGRNMGESPESDGTSVVYKEQNVSKIKLKEQVISLEDFLKLC
jgi:hypothetical protein